MKNNDMIKIAIIGAGASGLAAAVFSAREALRLKHNVSISLFDSNSRVGKKILVTGNGRCNFSNENVSVCNFHGDSEFAFKVYSDFTYSDSVEFFRSLGIFSKTDQAGRIYPMSMQASAVLDALRFECSRLGVREITDTKISDISRNGKGFILNNKFYADRVIVATGGKAAPVHGSDGNGFSLLSPFGILSTELYPALTPIVCDCFTKSLKGVRAQGKISIKCCGKLLSEDTGEIQYTDYGISGIPSMQVSRFAADALEQNKGEVYACVDSAPFFSEDELREILINLVRQHPDFTAEMLLSGIMPKKLGVFLLSACSLNMSRPIANLHNGVIEKIVSAVKNKKYKISSVKSFNDAQVTAGGIPASEIDASTMVLKKIKGIYVCGEIVNVDGDCGGYNLQWAWSSANKAGINIIREK